MIPTNFPFWIGDHIESFNLVIEKLMIPTVAVQDDGTEIDAAPEHVNLFQSRNRETFDSNLLNSRALYLM